MSVGAKVTLRRDKMWEFLDKFSMWLFRASVTSEVSIPIRLTERQLCNERQGAVDFP